MNSALQARDRGCGRGRRGDRRNHPVAWQCDRRWPRPDIVPGAPPSPTRIAVGESLAEPDPRGPSGGGCCMTPSHSPAPVVPCVGQAGCTERAGGRLHSRHVRRSRMGGPESHQRRSGSAEERTPARRSEPSASASAVVAVPSPVRGDRTYRPGPPSTSSQTALAEHPDLDVTSPVDVTLGGYSGKYLELRAPANTTTDELRTGPQRMQLLLRVGARASTPRGRTRLWRIWVLDVDGYPGGGPDTNSFPGDDSSRSNPKSSRSSTRSRSSPDATTRPGGVDRVGRAQSLTTLPGRSSSRIASA